MKVILVALILVSRSSAQFPGHEVNATVSCSEEGAFTCGDETCIAEEYLCDDNPNCSDKSDEANCDFPELPLVKQELAACDNKTQFTCADSKYCIPLKWHCNGEKDCPDGSDEHNCTSCHDGSVKCVDGTCISDMWWCDGHPDCPDGSDEADCKWQRGKIKEERPLLGCTFDNSLFMCHADDTCLPYKKYCNKVVDCRSGDDEGPFCDGWEKQCANVTCEQSCLPTKDGPRCQCPYGKKLDAKNICIDINLCDEKVGTCTQLCTSFNGGSSCECVQGYWLSDGIYKCHTTGNISGTLIYSKRHKINRMDIRTRKITTVINNTMQAVGVALHDKHLYWTEVFHGHESILRADIDNATGTKEVIAVFGIETPEDISVDWLTRNVYFTDSSERHIGVCTADGGHCTVLTDAYMHKPRSIALHSIRGEMFWTDWGNAPMIVRANMDGSSPVPIVDKDIVWPNGLFLDLPTERLFWVDGNNGGIYTVRLDGSKRHAILHDAVHHPYWIVVFEEYIYWSDWGSKKLMMSDKFNGKDRRTLDKGDVYGVHVWHPVMNPNKTHACVHRLCSDICVLKGADDYSCLCPLDKKLSPDKRHCIENSRQMNLVITGGNQMVKINYKPLGKLIPEPITLLVGSIAAQTYNRNTGLLYVFDAIQKSIKFVDMNNFKGGVTGILLSNDIEKITDMGFDYVTGNLYWVDSVKGSLEVLAVDQGHRAILHYFQGETPLSIAVVPEYGILVVALKRSDEKVHIDSFAMDGRTRRHLFDNGFVGPQVRIIFDAETDLLYIADSGDGIIATAHPLGTGRQRIKDVFTSVYSLAMLGDNLFWTDTKTKRIFWVDTRDIHSITKRAQLDLFGNDTQLFVSALVPALSTAHPTAQHPCAAHKPPCSYICAQKEHSVDAGADARYTCLCPNGMVEIVVNESAVCLERVQCAKYELTCHQSNLCMNITRKCNGVKDCPHGEDEEGCADPTSHKCKYDEFRCNDGQCVAASRRCDKFDDCLDGTDEADCSIIKLHGCSEGQWSCDNWTACIDTNDICDGTADCPGGEDEAPAHCAAPHCTDDKFQCRQGNCIPKAWECDGESDCLDGSDEHTKCGGGATCERDMFKCAAGSCVDAGLRCDGRDDCGDFSDEFDCDAYNVAEDANRCQGKELRCPTNSSICLPLTARCDGTADCPDGSDEEKCSMVCAEDEFRCKDARCIASELICDGYHDCIDGTDESQESCKISNMSNTRNVHILRMKCTDGYMCDSGECIDRAELCDGVNNCGDNSDENGACLTACKDHKCEHECVATARGAMCRCGAGYRLAGDAVSCEDDNECAARPSPCSHLCRNTIGSFICTCHHGYSLRSDRRTCKANGAPLQVLYIAGSTVRAMRTRGYLKVIYHASDITFFDDMDVDVREQAMYLTSQEEGKIYQVNVTTGSAVTIANIGHPTKVVVDWVTGNIYFADETLGDKCIRVCDVERMRCSRLQKYADDERITAMAIDPANHLLFYCMSEGGGAGRAANSSVMSSTLYGRRVSVLATARHCTALAADSHNKRLFLADNAPSEIVTLLYDGGVTQKIVTNSPFVGRAEALRLFEEHVYVQSAGEARLARCRLAGAVYCAPYGLNVHGARAMALYHASAQRQDVHNMCRMSQCAGVCVGAQEEPRCVCWDGTTPSDDQPCPKLPQEMLAVFSESTAVVRKRYVTAGVVVGVVVAVALVVVGAPLAYSRWHRRWLLKRARNQPPSVHFHNMPGGLGGVGGTGPHEPSVYIGAAASARYRDLMNPVERYIRNAWETLRHATSRKSGGPAFEVTPDEDSPDEDSEREGHDELEAKDKTKLVLGFGDSSRPHLHSHKSQHAAHSHFSKC